MVFQNLTDRLNHADLAQQPTTHTDTEEVIEQRKANQLVVDILKQHSPIPTSSIFKDLRLADSLGQGKSSIDLIIVSGWKIDCLMIKNWSGKISHDTENDTFQIFDESTKKLKQFDNPIKEIDRRSMLLKTYLNQCGIGLQNYHFHSRLVLTNKNLVDDTANSSIFNDSSVIRNIEYFAKSFINSWFWTISDPLLPSFISGSISYKQLTDVHISLAKLGTFDIAFLTGGRKLVGDFISSNPLIFDRKAVEEIEIVKKSLGISGRIKSAVGFFPEVSCILWRRGGQGWWFRSKECTIMMAYNKTVGFRISGESQDAVICINDIEKIILSS